MKINRQTKITGDLVFLVPYREIHVPRYHEWMSSEELQKLTASEPLSLEQEYEMQKSWADDEDKCTFIVLDKAKYEETNDEVDSMIGDTNIFMTDNTDVTLAEIEIMIAETCYRRNGRGKESTLLMLRYGKEQLGIKQFHAKIGLDNIASIQMFQKIGFREISRSEIFGEVTMAVFSDDDAFVRYLKDHIGQYNVSNHY
ncbi:alpha/beta-tubulin-N-acetyltransferase 9-like [Daphnia carinata]|uniref:alpha/beta-tubulin-N-acetyltransferase 9-like n=1 Tax=Daphnia carinata TaxID=120202 RepID=UPI00257EF443|nr:alpha/beta-tubulin-N-acetyltransferase 9-like [Daphnia carinata]